MKIYYWIIAIVIIVFAIAIFFQGSKLLACTQEAKICPDGSAVGRIPPDCNFAPCPSCKCPYGFVPATAGDYCVAKCEPNEECPYIAVACQNVTQCNCPEGYIQEGDVCNPACYYNSPKCLVPSILCNATNNQSTDELCIASGGTVTTQLCCQSSGDFPNTCLIGACGCSPNNSHDVKVCNCGEGKCWDSTKQACSIQ